MNQIRHFLAVTEKGNFTRAAEFSYISQPSLTQSIKNLEDELGGPLFIRDRAGCQLTALGRLIEPKLRQIYEQTHLTRKEAIRFSKKDKIPIRAGVMHTIGSNLLVKAFARFQLENPTAELELLVDSDKRLLNKLYSGDLDMVITSHKFQVSRGFRSRDIYREDYYFTFSSQHPINEYESIGLEVLKKYPYLDRLNCEFRDDLTQLCSQKNIELDAAYRSNDEHWILEMARQGAGVALMPEYSLPENRDHLSTKKLTDPELQRTILVIYSSRMQHKPTIDALITCLCY